MKTFKFHIPAFVIAFALGILYVYVATPHRQVVVKQPTPQNAGKVVYNDEHENCYVLDYEKTKC